MSNKQFGWILGAFITLIATISISLGVFLSRSSSLRDKYTFRIQRENIELMYEGSRADLVRCIDSVIRVCAPTTCMNGLEILRQCEKYNVDLFFVLSQCHVESHFGTRGLALKTNSVFNVFAYDGYGYSQISKKGKYSHPDLSIEPYLKLLKTRYLVDGKTEADLMNKYVDVSGKRYASSDEYEFALINMYQRYTTDSPLMNTYKQYTKYKILAGK